MARKKQENLEEKIMESELGPTADDIIKLWNESGSTEEETEVTEEEKGTEEPTEEERQSAEHQLRRHLLMEGLRKKLDIRVSDEELDTLLQQRAKDYGTTVEDLKRSGRVDDLRHELEESKVFDLLASKAKITEESI